MEAKSEMINNNILKSKKNKMAAVDIPIYKVKIQQIYTGCRIEGVGCKIYLVQSRENAYNFAYEKALEYYKNNDNKIPDNGEIKKSEIYTRSLYKWCCSDYEEWEKYLIKVEEDILCLSDDVVNVVSINI